MPRGQRRAGGDASRGPEQRARVASEAARLVAQGLADPEEARQRAARALGVEGRDALPAMADVQAALRDYLRLFRGPAQAEALRALREAALEAMDFLSDFEPRLVGPVLDGTADAGAPVQLQLFADEPEALPRLLADRGIPAQAAERRLRGPGGRMERVPAWIVTAGGVVVELVPLPRAWLRQALPGADPGTRLARASLSDVRALLVRDA